MANPVEALVGALKTHLATISGLTVRAEWPTANQKLVMPSVTITRGEAKYTNLMPYALTTTAPNGQLQVTSTLVVGMYDLQLQLDLWCRNKVERETFFGLLFTKLNPQISPMGLSLQLADHFNEWARYDLDEHQFVDDEAGAQRQEWRAKFKLLGNVKHIMQKTDFGIITVENQLTTPDNIP